MNNGIDLGVNKLIAMLGIMSLSLSVWAQDVSDLIFEDSIEKEVSLMNEFLFDGFQATLSEENMSIFELAEEQLFSIESGLVDVNDSLPDPGVVEIDEWADARIRAHLQVRELMMSVLKESQIAKIRDHLAAKHRREKLKFNNSSFGSMGFMQADATCPGIEPIENGCCAYRAIRIRNKYYTGFLADDPDVISGNCQYFTALD